ncbi:MAG: transketolase [Ruegeria sp.]
MRDDVSLLSEIEARVRWLAAWTIHSANHNRPAADGEVKVGGHQASSASLTTLMTALYFKILNPEDRVAIKPHASPVFHAIQYLAGRQSLEKLQNFRGFGGAQSYPSRTKDTDDVDFSTGSVGLGVAQTIFSSLVQDYILEKNWSPVAKPGRMVALLGDAEMDEGNVYEALLEGWKHGLRNCWWVVDYNRQSLDGVVQEGLWERLLNIFESFGWDVVVLKHGTKQVESFAQPGGEALRDWIDQCPNQIYAALTFQGGAAWRKALLEDLGRQKDVVKLLKSYDDEQLSELMCNLGGHDFESILGAFEDARQHERPTVFICYTIKGYGLPLAGHKDNHAGLMTGGQIETLRSKSGVKPQDEWAKLDGLPGVEAIRDLIKTAPFFSTKNRRLSAPKIKLDAEFPAPDTKQKPMSTQAGFGQILHEIAKSDSELSKRIVTTAPDVAVSTNLGPWINRNGLFSKQPKTDAFKDARIPSAYKWEASPAGQHFELGIAESNLFLMLSALGLSHHLNGQRLLPVGTVYDPFIFRAADQLNYACYQDARFLLAGTPSGVTLAPEGGAHQSISTPMLGIAQDGLAYFEPSYLDELAVIIRFAFDYMQRDGDKKPEPGTWLRDQTGGSVYLRLSTRPLEQITLPMTPTREADIIRGAYWVREPGPNTELVIAYTGAVAPEALRAVSLAQEDRRNVGLLAVTSPDRLHAGWSAAQAARGQGKQDAEAHIERLLKPLSRNCSVVTVIDGHPATLAWIGGVCGHPTRALGVEQFGQSGRVADLYRHFGIDTRGILDAVSQISPGRPLRHLEAT